MLMPTHEARLDALRKELAKQGLDGLRDSDLGRAPFGIRRRLCPAARVADRVRRLGGDRGGAQHKAAMFVDGRYTLQVRDQVDGRLYEYKSVPQDSIGAWLAGNVEPGARIGFDPWLHTAGWAKAVRKALEEAGAELVPVAGNPVDAVWSDQPEPSAAPAFIQDDALAGRSSADKRGEVAEWLKREKLDAAVISALDSVAWLLNVRGGRRRAHAGRAVVRDRACDGTADWFIAPGKVPPEVAAHLGNAVRVRPRDTFTAALAELAGKRVAADPERSVAAIFAALEDAGAEAVRLTDPVVLPKAVKNAAEQAGHRAAQARDGAAVARFLHWLSVEGPTGTVDELGAARAAAAVPQGHRRLARPVVRHDQRRGTERRDRPLPGERGNQPPARAGQRVPGRFGRAVCLTARPTSPAPCGSGPAKRRPR
jgi:Xaa-Pro aminopeptidase